MAHGSAARLSTPSRLTMYGGLFLGLAVFLLFGVIPTAANILMAFTNYTSLPGVGTDFVGWSNFGDLISTELPGFIGSLEATAAFVIGVTVVQNGIALALAHRLQNDNRSASVLRILVFMPIVLGVTVVALIWLLLLDPTGGPGASVLHVFGLQSAFFGSDTAAMPLVIIVQVWQNLGFSMIVFIGALKSIPVSVYEAAALDGVTPWLRFTRITWPLLAPAVTVNVLFAVIGSVTTYNLIYVLTGGENGTNTLGMFAFNSAFGSTANLGLGAAITTALFVATVVLAVPVALGLRAHERRVLG